MISNLKIQEIFSKLGQSVKKSTILGKGEASVVIKVTTNKDTYALKTALYSKRKAKVLREAEFRSFFIDSGLTCVPKPIYTDKTIFPNGAVIYEFANGQKPKEFSKDNLLQFAKIISEIHSIKYEIIDDGFSQIQRTAKFLNEIITKITKNYPHLMNPLIEESFRKAQEEFQQRIESKSEFFTIGVNAQLHGDLSDNFVIDKDDKIWLIDWENSEYGDTLEEIFWFLFVNEITFENRILFYKEYQKWFDPAKSINYKELEIFYYSVTPVFNICWGINQLDMNIKQELEPERKLKDLEKSAKNWIPYYTAKTSATILQGVHKLQDFVTTEYLTSNLQRK